MGMIPEKAILACLALTGNKGESQRYEVEWLARIHVNYEVNPLRAFPEIDQ